MFKYKIILFCYYIIFNLNHPFEYNNINTIYLIDTSKNITTCLHQDASYKQHVNFKLHAYRYI